MSNMIQTRIPPIMARDKYGKAIDSLEVNSYIVIEESYREKCLHYARRKFKLGIAEDEQRIYKTETQEGELRLFRLK